MKVISIRQQGKKGNCVRRITVPDGICLLEALQKNHIFIPAYCGGAGKCKKCGVRLEEGSLPVTEEDKAAFSKEELEKGMRLSCRAAVKENLALSIPPQEEAFAAVSSGNRKNVLMNPDNPRGEGEYGIAIDIGTTTLAFALLDLHSGEITDSCTMTNSQRVFGADVISRIQASNSGNGERLKQMIQADIQNGICALAEKNLSESHRICHIAIAANTVMLHLLRGYSCKGLGSYPFAPETLLLEELDFAEAFGESEDARAAHARVTLLPGISAFIGADITSGLYACRIFDGSESTLFLDLGTNGEMALRAGERVFAASAAAGPAFEGGNISHGTGSLPGAICKASIKDGVPKVWTIDGAAPVGICGTGVIEAAAELFSDGIIDRTGKLADPYFPKGFPLAKNALGEEILLTQQDIREIQMAKAAVRAGIEVLLARAGLCYADVGKVFLAGGFGSFLDVGKAAKIGLLPDALADKAEAAGNTALYGALLYLAGRDREALQKITESVEEIPLAGDGAFQEKYYQYMMF